MSYYKDQEQELIPESREARIRDTYIKCSRLEAENKELRSIIECLLTMEVHDYDALAIKQDAKEMYEALNEK